LIYSARLAGDYLIRIQKEDGSFSYVYDAAKDSFPSTRYNILRHAGTAIALLQLCSATNDRLYLDAARKATSYLRSRFRQATGDAIYVLDHDGKAKLGANGLALIALVRSYQLGDQKPTKQQREECEGLARLILSLQNRDGLFESYYRIRGDEPRGSVSLYYPGEAILGLISLHELTGDKKLLQAAQQGAGALIEAQQVKGPLPPDAWLMQALEALHRKSPDPRYSRHALEIAQAIMALQYDGKDGPEYAGGFGPAEPRTTQAAARAEGLLAAFKLARASEDPRTARIAAALRAAARFQLSRQYTPASSKGLPNPRRALGAFREGQSAGLIRIDFVQHNISALLGIAEALY
jgi:uncharacterized protein YyaL (SSP411 family)